jgi:hypothetical protein
LVSITSIIIIGIGVTALGVASYYTYNLLTEDSPQGQQSPEFFAGKNLKGKSLEKLAQEYWQWVAEATPEDIPKDTKTNLNECRLGYDKDNMTIFLLTPYDVTYSAECTISSDKYLLVPLLVGECDPTVPEKRTKSGRIEDLWACAREADEPFDIWKVTLDNRVIFKNVAWLKVNADLKDEILVRNSSRFIIEIPKVNSFEVAAGSYPAVVDGYYLPLNPLTPGEHVLQSKIVFKQPALPLLPKYNPGEVTYHLTVNP